jgi:cyclic 2,3-diphosphoglycerate synthetase
VVLTHCEDGTQFERIRAAVAEVKDVPTIATVQRPRPVAPVAGRRVALFTTAPPAAQEVLGEHLEREHGAVEVAVSGNLADRTALRADLERIDAEVFVVELKAAAVDVVAEAALERGIPLVLADADIRTLQGEPDLDEALLALVRAPEPSVG